jgi:hypothetical protein
MSLGSTSEITEIVKHLLVRPMVTTRDHMKGRGLARKSSAHCVFLSGREKAPKASNAADVLEVTARTN